MATRILRFSAIALTVLLGGACGSSATDASKPLPKLSLTTAAVGSAADAARAPGALPIRPTSYVFDGALPDLGTTAPVYRWTAHTVNLAEVERLAHALGIDATATTTPDGFQATDGTTTLTVSVANGSTSVSSFLGGPNAVSGGSSGSSSGSSGAGSAGAEGTNPAGSVESPPLEPTQPPLPPDAQTTLPLRRTPPVDVPSAHDAEKIAHDLLDGAGLLGDAQWTSEVTNSGGIAVSCAVGQTCSAAPEQVSARDVTFTLSVDGVRVEGISWTVTIGERSRIESVSGDWGSAVVVGPYALRSTTAAFDALQHGDSTNGGPEPLAGEVPVKAQDTPATLPTVVDPVAPDPSAPDPVTVHVTGVSLGLARWDAVDGDQNVVDLVPIYVFHTGVADGSYDITELALDPAAIDFAKPIVHPVPIPVPIPVPEPGGTPGAPASIPKPSG